MRKLKTISDTENLKEAYKEAEEDGYDGVKVVTRAKIEKKEAEDRDGMTAYPVIMSTPEKNRNGRIVVSNFVKEYFEQNPVLLDSHKYDSIEHIIGRVENLRTKDGNLEGDLVFNDQLKGRMAQEMMENGFLQAVSIGYLPLEFEVDETEEGELLTIITEAELLELSMVSVPSNRKSLKKQLESMDDKDVEKVKDVLQEEGRTLSAKNKSDLKEAISLLETVLSRGEQESVDEYEVEGDTEAEREPESEENDEDDEEPELIEEEPIEDPDFDAESLLQRAIEDIKRERRQTLKNVAKDLDKTHEGNIHKQKREVWKNLRKLM